MVCRFPSLHSFGGEGVVLDEKRTALNPSTSTPEKVTSVPDIFETFERQHYEMLEDFAFENGYYPKAKIFISRYMMLELFKCPESHRRFRLEQDGYWYEMTPVKVIHTRKQFFVIILQPEPQ